MKDISGFFLFGGRGGGGEGGAKTHNPACQLPSPLIASACAAVMVMRLCVSAKLADSRASCEFSCACLSLLVHTNVATTRAAQ